MNLLGIGSGRILVVGSLILFIMFLPVRVALTEQSDAAGKGNLAGCPSLQQTSYPKTSISNGIVNAVVYLPDAKNGYYRGLRFDWSGVVGCLAYKGHTYFGVWFPRYDPLLHDSITGPVEEFRSNDGLSSVNYREAKPGEPFLKPGVGVLRKVDDSPYAFTATYPLIDGGKWTVHTKRNGVSFRQDLHSEAGFAYVYKKTVRLEKDQPILILEHELKNTGRKTIDTQVYDHDFFMLDDAPTGPGMVVHFPFEPKAERPLRYGGKIDGKEIVYQQELQPKPREAVTSYLTGFSPSIADYDMVVENRNGGVGVEQTADVPMSQLNFWSIHSTICPEAYIHLNIPPGRTAHWTIRYRFFAK
jgi:hypothetical protein